MGSEQQLVAKGKESSRETEAVVAAHLMAWHSNTNEVLLGSSTSLIV